MSVSPLKVMVLGDGKMDRKGRGYELEPMMMSEAAREMGVPETVIPGPLGERVDPAMATPPDVAVKTWPPMVNVCSELGVKGVGRAKVLEPMMTLEGPREIEVPDIVTPGP